MKHDENLCAEIDSSLPLYVGGDLEAQALGEVRRHLAECPRCAERALSARAARRELVAALRIGSTPGPDLWAGVRAALADDGVLAAQPGPRSTTSHAWRFSRPWGFAAAAAAVALAFWIGARWNDGSGDGLTPRGDGAPRGGGTPTVVQQPRVREPRPLDVREDPRMIVTPVVDTANGFTGEFASSESVRTSGEPALVSGPGGGLRRLNPDERQLHDSAPRILGDRAYLLGAPQSGAMQPVVLRQAVTTTPRW